MRRRAVDVLVIGAGTAGLVARRTAADRGADTLLVDGGPLGTTCARVGCMPSKLLIAAADAAERARRAHHLGVEVTGIEVDGPAVLERLRRERDRFVGFVLETVRELEADGHLVRGNAQFLAEGRVRVGEDLEVEAKAVVIATGSTPVVPPPYRGLGDALVTTDAFFEQETLPESLLVVGTGVIALELGQAVARLGSRVTLVGLDEQVGPIADPEVAAEARRVFGEALDLVLSYHLASVARDPRGGARVRFRTAAGVWRDERFEQVLVAAGRRPHLAHLGLDRAGAPLEDTELWQVDPLSLQLGDRPMFVAGDAAGHRPLLHEAADEGRIAGANAAALATRADVRAFVRKTPLAIVFTEPQMAVVGSGFQSADERRCGSVDFGNQGRARVMGVNEGLVRVYGDRATGRLLGAEMLGPTVEHLAHLVAWLVQLGVTVDQALELPFYHPVTEEGLRSALRALQRSLKHAGPEPPDCEWSGPGS